jgi:membrane protein required for colicin V production
MQTYDLVMLAVLAAATLFGFWKGLAWQIASLASLVASYFLALKFADRLAPMVSQHAPWNKFLAMLIIYAGASAAIWMIYRIIGGAIDRVKLNEFDRQMGALVGFAKGVLLCIAITFFAVTLLGQVQRDKIVASKSGQYIVQILDKADAVAPPEIHEVIGDAIQRIKRPLVDPTYQPSAGQDLQGLGELFRQQAAQAGQAAANAAGQAVTNGWPAASGSSSTTTGGQGATGSFNWQTMPTATQPTTPPQTPAFPISTGGNRR